MPRALVLAALLVIACSRPPLPIAQPSPSSEPGLLEVTVLLDLSGPRAPRGDPQRNAVQLWTDLEQSRGGKVRSRVRIVDVAGSDARVLIELRRAATEERADAVVIGVPVALGAAGLADAARAAALPLLFTLPVPEPVATPGGRWLFALAPTPEQLARATAELPEGGSLIDTFALVPDGRSHDDETAALLREYARRAGTPPAVLSVDRARADEQRTAARITGGARRVHLAGAPREWNAFAQAFKQGARPLATRLVLSYLTEPADLGELRDGLDAVWPAPLGLTSSAPGSAAAGRRQFLQAYSDRHGPPTAHAATAYDALTLLLQAAERSGADDRERLREQLETVTFTGAATTYAFSVTRHAGYAGDDLALYRWNGSAAVPDARR